MALADGRWVALGRVLATNPLLRHGWPLSHAFGAVPVVIDLARQPVAASDEDTAPERA